MYHIRNWRGKLINQLIKQRQAKNYLELGISVGECWREIDFDAKTGVDTKVEVDDNRIVCKTTDEFFSGTDQKFDIIFIDACHRKDFVFSDFTNSFNHLNDGGVIILHDINPICEDDLLPERLWDCFEFWMELVTHYKDKCRTLVEFPDDKEGTFGLFYKEKGDLFDPNLIKEMDRGYAHFDVNREKYIHSLVTKRSELLGMYDYNL